MDYKFSYDTDIADCYGSLYTHSIAWAIETIGIAKKQRDGKLLGNTIDAHIRNMQYGQTNGIPQGSVLMDFIAEIILGYMDELLAAEISKNKIKESEINYNGIKMVENKIYFWNKFEKIWERKSSMTLLSSLEKRNLADFVNYVNEYCNKQRWRAEEREEYYYIEEDDLTIEKTQELSYACDDRNYDKGNYFKTQKEAEEVLEKLEEFWKAIREEMEK